MTGWRNDNYTDDNDDYDTDDDDNDDDFDVGVSEYQCVPLHHLPPLPFRFSSHIFIQGAVDYDYDDFDDC